jgi:hypothetical protein
MRWPRGRFHRQKVGGFDDINTQKAKVELYLEIDWFNCQPATKQGWTTPVGPPLMSNAGDN